MSWFFLRFWSFYVMFLHSSFFSMFYLFFPNKFSDRVHTDRCGTSTFRRRRRVPSFVSLVALPPESCRFPTIVSRRQSPSLKSISFLRSLLTIFLTLFTTLLFMQSWNIFSSFLLVMILEHTSTKLILYLIVIKMIKKSWLRWKIQNYSLRSFITVVFE